MTNPADTARRDQIAAAARNIRAGLNVAAKLTGATTTTTSPGGPLGVRLDAWRASAVRYGCPHLANPQPVIGALTDPGVIYCIPCGLTVTARWASDHPDTCDACNQRSRLFHEINHGVGPLLITGNVCPGCYRAIRKNQQ